MVLIFKGNCECQFRQGSLHQTAISQRFYVPCNLDTICYQDTARLSIRRSRLRGLSVDEKVSRLASRRCHTCQDLPVMSPLFTRAQYFSEGLAFDLRRSRCFRVLDFVISEPELGRRSTLRCTVNPLLISPSILDAMVSIPKASGLS